MLHRKIFENLLTAMAILVLFFNNFKGKFVIFSATNFECFADDAFCSRSVYCACLRQLRHIVMKKFEIMEKFYSSKTLMKMAGGGCIRSIPHIPPWIRPWLYNNKR